MAKLHFTITLVLLSLALLFGARETVRPTKDSTRNGRTVEVAMFEGGYGIDWHAKIARQYMDAHKDDGILINLWGDQRVDEIIKPRIMRGNPPDIIHQLQMPVWRMIAAGKLRPFDEVLDMPAYGSDRKWRDLFIPGTLATYTSEGHVYGIPSAFGVNGIWYDAKLFREHGWTPPKTWSELDALCRAIRAAGIEPIAFQGKYPTYAWGVYITLVQRLGGVAALNRINALEDGAFLQPEAIRAAELLQNLATAYFQKGAMAMTHTESQLQFVNRKAALIFCGVWLENEQKTTTPPDFEMRCFNVPAVEGGKGNPLAYNAEGGEWFLATADGTHTTEGMDFVRYLVSPTNAPDLGRTISVISPLKGATPRDALSPALQSVLDIMDRAPGIYSVRLPYLLLRWNTEDCTPAIGDLLGGRITPQQYCEKLERGIQIDKHNPDVIVPPFDPVDPKTFGEPG